MIFSFTAKTEQEINKNKTNITKFVVSFFLFIGKTVEYLYKISRTKYRQAEKYASFKVQREYFGAFLFTKKVFFEREKNTF